MSESERSERKSGETQESGRTYVCLYVCMYVSERERERKKQGSENAKEGVQALLAFRYDTQA